MEIFRGVPKTGLVVGLPSGAPVAGAAKCPVVANPLNWMLGVAPFPQAVKPRVSLKCDNVFEEKGVGLAVAGMVSENQEFSVL